MNIRLPALAMAGLLLGLGLILAGGHARADAPAADAPAADAAAEPRSDPADIGLSEVVEVTGRLGAAVAGPASPAGQLLTGDDLAAGEARSVPEALSRSPVIQSIDQVGNGRQLALGMRGFSGAEGATAMVVDGVRLNDPDTNAAAWELLRLEDVERVAIVGGPAGARVGGGSPAGLVHVVRRRPSDEPEADVRLRGGEGGHRDASAVVSGPAGRWRLLASVGAFEDDGFRQRAGSSEASTRLAATRDVGSVQLHVDWSRMQGRWRHPGALTAAELRDDPSAAPFNLLDVHEASQDLALARATWEGARTRVVGVASFRNRSSDILSTGRSCYGYRVEDSHQAQGITLEGETTARLPGPARLAGHARLPGTAGQAGAARRPGSPRLAIRWGVEASRDRLHPEGFFTDDTCDGEITHEAPSSAVDLDWDRGAVFGGVAATWPSGFGVEMSARHDRSRVAREGAEISGAGTWQEVAGRRSFSDTTLRVSAGRRTEGGTFSWSAAWEESFLAPSAIQLFALPGFFSNPDLAPQRGGGPSLSLEVHRARLRATWTLFHVAMRDEIAYDAQELRSINAGTTRRRGVETHLAFTPARGVELRLGHVLVDATYRGGFPEGTRVRKGAGVPLVARHATTLGLHLGPWRGFSAALHGRHVGSMPLDSDLDGSEPRLGSRSLVALALRQDLPAVIGLSVHLAGENLLDDRTPARGIAFGAERYFTPPAPRRMTFGVSWRLP